MDVSEINLADLLRFEPEQGQIWLKDYRMVMLSACALGTLRRELIDTIGWADARRLLKRFGYAAGLADGKALAERFPDATGDRHLDFGPALHGLEGIAGVERIPERSEIDLASGRFHVEAYWINSYEADQQLELLGRSEEPACWTLVGYVRGHSAAATGRRTVVAEIECRAMGHERCRFVACFAEDLPDIAEKEERDYASRYLPELLRELHNQLQESEQARLSSVKRAEKLRSEVERVRPRGRFIGTSGALHAALETAHAVAPYEATVLIVGESGTGKELLARFIHDHSSRAQEVFLAVNCSALPETLQDSELFGHAKGAFTGAVTDRAGVFEAAASGTLFLDEIGDLAPTAQAKILRALQEGEIVRVGETRRRAFDARILAATNHDLAALRDTGAFREDLFYRLSVVEVCLPPLRERENDALLLAEHFLRLYSRKFKKKVREFAPEAMAAIGESRWPGNVRELQNAIQHAVLLASGPRVELRDLPVSLRTPGRGRLSRGVRAHSGRDPSLAQIEDEAERIRRALELAEDNREQAAALLGISRTTLWRKLKALAEDDSRDS